MKNFQINITIMFIENRCYEKTLNYFIQIFLFKIKRVINAKKNEI